MLGPRLGVWHTLFADDGLVGKDFPSAPLSILMVMLLFIVLKVPLSWKKIQGGVEVDYVGYRLSLSSYAVGLSEKRANWLNRWLTEKAEKGVKY